MNSKTTWLLTALALVLGLYLAFFETPSTRVSSANATPDLLQNFDPQKVTALSIRSTNTVIRAEKIAGQWRLASPSYPAQQAAIQQLLDVIAHLKNHGFISPNEIQAQPSGPGAFGFNSAAPLLILAQETNRIQLSIGRKTLVKDQVYVRIQDTPGLFVTSTDILRVLPASADDLRDRQLTSDLRTFDHVEVQSGVGFELQYESASHLWRLKKPMSARADASRVQAFLQKLNTARIARFVTDDPPADLEPFGLATPDAELRLGRGTNTLLQIQFGKSPSNDLAHVFARCSAHTNIVLVPKDLLSLVKTPYLFFRDRSLLTFAPHDIDEVHLRMSQDFTLQRQTNNSWQVIDPVKLNADAQLASDLLHNLAKLQIAEFHRDVVADFSPFGLIPPARQITLGKSVFTPAGRTNQTVIQVDFSTNNVLGQPDKVFARRSDENSVYTVSYGDLMQLPSEPYLLRDRQIWSFSPANITTIRITAKGRSRTIQRSASGSWPLDPVRNQALMETLFRLSHLKAVEWVAHSNRQLQVLNFPGVNYSISLEENLAGVPATFSIQFGPLARQGPYAAVLFPGEKEHSIFIFPATTYGLVAENLSAGPDTVAK